MASGSSETAEVEVIEEVKPPSTSHSFYFQPKRKHEENNYDNFNSKNNKGIKPSDSNKKKTSKFEKEKNGDDDDDDKNEKSTGGFKSGGEELKRRVNQGLYKNASQQPAVLAHLYGQSTNRNVFRNGGGRHDFKVPFVGHSSTPPVVSTSAKFYDRRKSPPSVDFSSPRTETTEKKEEEVKKSPDSLLYNGLKSLDADLVAIIEKEILEVKSSVAWDEIAGLDGEKKAIKEMVLWPLLRPDLFHGIRSPPQGLLLYGPPGTGKTLIGRCIASQAKATFFNISASSLTSKWVGEGEKLVRTLFDVARLRLPAVVFIDEVDSLLSQRSENEHESSRRMKTEFLQQLDGAKTNAEDHLLLVGATNRPHELDAAARRRFTRRIYIPLPDKSARCAIIKRLLTDQKHNLADEQIENVAEVTNNYSCADVTNLCKEAALGPLRMLDNIEDITLDDVPPISFEHFEKALLKIGPSVSTNDLNIFKEFNETFGYKQQ